MLGSISRIVPGLTAALVLIAAGAAGPARANEGCAGPCPEAGGPAQTLAADQPEIADDKAAQCRQMAKDNRLALALFGMCHSFAEPTDRLCVDYSNACERMRAAGCAADWAACD